MKYIILGNLNAEWVGRQTERLTAVRAKAEDLGITIDSIHYTQGVYDFIVQVDASDAYVVLVFSMWYAKQGYGRMTTMPAFEVEQMEQAVEQL